MQFYFNEKIHFTIILFIQYNTKMYKNKERDNFSMIKIYLQKASPILEARYFSLFKTGADTTLITIGI